SGGEQQRVAVARAIAPRPGLLLLDEPLSALDARLRRSVRSDLQSLLSGLGATVLYVTHDPEEAMSLADRLVVLDRGAVRQAGPAIEVYRRPLLEPVARLLGEANLLEAALVGSAARAATALGALDVSLGSLPPRDGARGLVLLRPEEIEIAPDGRA